MNLNVLSSHEQNAQISFNSLIKENCPLFLLLRALTMFSFKIWHKALLGENVSSLFK